MGKILGSVFLCAISVNAYGWRNGQSVNASTNLVNECQNPPYSTHDYIPDKAFTLLPGDEKEWVLPFRTMFLLGTEAPDNDDIPLECGAPNTGYDDRRRGHSVEWLPDFSAFALKNNGDTRDRGCS